MPKNNVIKKIEVDECGNVRFTFNNSLENDSCIASEFEFNSKTRVALEMIEALIVVWNDFEESSKNGE